MAKSKKKTYLVTVRAHMDMIFEVAATSKEDAIAQAQIPEALDSAHSEDEIEYDWASARVRPKK